MRRRSQTRDRYKDSESISDDSDYIDDSNQQRRKSLTNRRHYPHVIVTHNYHDHANEPVAESFPPENHGKTRSRRTIGVNVSFPIKLYEMLEVTEKDGLADIISWQPHGRCFLVHEPDQFKETMSKYFKLSKISSFQRQLNLYGFTRLTAGPDKNGYYHEYFLRGRPDLAALIHRNKVKGTGVRAKSNPNAEPNFYAYPAIDLKAWEVIEDADGKREAAGVFPKTDLPFSFYSLERSHTDAGIHDDIWKPNSTYEKDLLATEQKSLVDVMMYHKAQDLDESYNSLKPNLRILDETGSTSEVSFDALIDEMFCRDQTLDFQDLLKLAAL